MFYLDFISSDESEDTASSFKNQKQVLTFTISSHKGPQCSKLCYVSEDLDGEHHLTLTKKQLLKFHSLRGGDHLFPCHSNHRCDQEHPLINYYRYTSERSLEPQDDLQPDLHLKGEVLKWLDGGNQKYVMTFILTDFYSFDKEGYDSILAYCSPVYHQVILTRTQYVIFSSHPGLIFKMHDHESDEKRLYWEFHRSRLLLPGESVSIDERLTAQVLTQISEIEAVK